MPEPQGTGWLRADSECTLHTQNSQQTHGEGGAVSAVWICSGPEEAKLGRPAALSNSARPARFGSSPGPHNHPVPKGQQCSLAEGPLHKGQGREDGLSQMRLERLSLEAENSSSVLAAENRLGARHLLRSDPCSWEKQHKRQHGFSLSNTGLFTQANKHSWRAERDTEKI